MLGKQHVQFALITSTAAYFTLHSHIAGMSEPVVFIASAAIGSLIPDIDSPTSTAGQFLPPISSVINRLFGHRTVTHDALFWGIVAGICYYFFPMTIGFWFGYLGHLFLDGFTKSGICWAYPFHKRTLKLCQQYATLSDGCIHLLPRKLRMSSSGSVAVFFTFILSVAVSYGLYQLGIML